MSVNSDIGDRMDEFHETFGGSEFIEDSVIEATEKIWEVASVMYGEEASDSAFNVLVGSCFPAVVREEGWRDGLHSEAFGIYSETPGGGLLHDLTAYADFGLLLASWNDLESAEAALKKQVDAGVTLLNLLAANMEEPRTSPIWRVVSKAYARWKLDSNQPLNKIDLSLLSGLAEQSIRNRLSGKTRELEGTIDRVEAAEALKWLPYQKGFVSSIWRHQTGQEYQLGEAGTLDAVFFVPIASDGTLFHPGLQEDGVFIVGYAGEEAEYESYEAALGRLQEMLQPIWRRPMENNRWTQVQGVRWARLTREDLDAVGRRR